MVYNYCIRKGEGYMQVQSVNSTPLYTKRQIKSELKTAATSAALSAGLTLVLNKGKDFKRAGLVGAFAAGVSMTIGFIQRLINHNKEVKNSQAQSTEKSIKTHQG